MANKDFEEVCRLEYLINRVNNYKQLDNIRGTPGFNDWSNYKEKKKRILLIYGLNFCLTNINDI